MSDEAWKALAIIIPSVSAGLFGLLYRLWSRREHKKGQDFMTNGGLEKKIKDAVMAALNETKKKDWD